MENQETMQAILEEMGKRARKAAAALATADADQKRRCLETMAEMIEKYATEIASVNAGDAEKAKGSLSPAMLDRLTLTPARIAGMADGLRTVARQEDPIGKILDVTHRPNGLEITKISVPFGVIGIVYEARPNVTADASGICLKAGNSVILRGGSEAFESNRFLAELLDRAAQSCGFPEGVIQFVPWVDREAVKLMLKMDRWIDLVIPRGGEGLIRMVVTEATMPVLKHYKGVCHLFVDSECDFEMAVKVIVNAKCSRPGVCNALETLLISRPAAEKFIPLFLRAMKENHVELHGDEAFCSLCPEAIPATEADYYAEYLSLTLAVRIVDDVQQAVEHINTYGSRHSDGILTANPENAAYFTANVDSATVYVNASTRFTDGGEFGKGAEIGISTDKLHARGPMGADELTSYKYIVRGSGQIR